MHGIIAKVRQYMGDNTNSGTQTLERPGKTQRRTHRAKNKMSKKNKSTSLTKAGAKLLTKKNLGRVAMGIGATAAVLTIGNVAYRMYKGASVGLACKQALGFGPLEVEA